VAQWVIPVGPTGTYPTLTAAFAALGSGISGAVVLELQSNYTSAGETFPITIGSNACFNAANTLTIRPAAGANGLDITGSNAGPTIDLTGVRYVTIDGRPGGTGSAISVTAASSLNTINLNIINTSTSGAAIRLDNGASNNTINIFAICREKVQRLPVYPHPGRGGILGNTGAGGKTTIRSIIVTFTPPVRYHKRLSGFTSLGYDNTSTTAAYVSAIQ